MELGRKKTDWSLYSQVMQASRKVGKESELDSIAPKSVLKYLSCAEKKPLYTGQGPIDRPCLLIYILLYSWAPNKPSKK